MKYKKFNQSQPFQPFQIASIKIVRSFLLEVFTSFVLLVFTQEQATKENEYEVLFVPWCNSRIRDADAAVECNEDHLAKLVFYKQDERSSRVIEVVVCL